MFHRVYKLYATSRFPLLKGNGATSHWFGKVLTVHFSELVQQHSKYIGETVKGNRHGRGKLVFPGGEVLEGEFKDNVIYNGSGVLVTSNKTVYEGTWAEGKLSGYCKKRTLTAVH